MNGGNLFRATFNYIFKKCNFLKIADANSIFADAKSIMQLPRQHFFADVKKIELERLNKSKLTTISSSVRPWTLCTVTYPSKHLWKQCPSMVVPHLLMEF